MSYSKLNNSDKTINYLSKDFNDFRSSLNNLAKIYFPDTYNDFSEASPGTMFIEMASYVGDILSFYTDAQIQEIFIQYAQERENLFGIAYNLGYVPAVTNPSSVELDLYQQIPADSDGLPDYRYAFRVNRNSTFLPNNSSNVSFLIQNSVNFGVSSSVDPTEQTIWSIDSTTNKPTYYLLKKKVRAISADLRTITFDIGSPEKFKTLTINDTNIIGIESITDSDNNTWTEVPYLAQETIFEEVANIAANSPDLAQYNNQIPYLLRTKKVPKRFITRFKSDNTLEIQFGSGISSGADSEIIPNPDNIGLGIKDGRSLLDFSFDPSNFLYTKAYGEVPANTTLTINYLVGGGVGSNVPANTINRIGSTNISPNYGNLNTSVFNTAVNSLACNNPSPALGGGNGDSAEDIRLNAIANFAAQKRAVTKDDYIFRTLAMPSQFGKIAKAYIIQDTQISLDTSKRIANPNALNLYILGYDINKKLTTLSNLAKSNLAVYLDQYRMLTDSINIKDAYVINFQIDFEIVVGKQYNNEAVLLECIQKLQRFFNIDRWQVNQPIVYGDILSELYNTNGVQSVGNIIMTNISGESQGYSRYKYDFDVATRDGVIYPSQDPSIFELKYPNIDIKGKVKSI